MTKTARAPKKVWQKILIAFAIFLVAILVIVGGYVAYVFIAYHRLGTFAVTAEGKAAADKVSLATDYTLVSYNIGFGAYESDYDFFMDGGKQSRAPSKERLDTNLKNIAAFLKNRNADFYFIQEVDFESTRTYHVDERNYLNEALAGRSHIFAQNYDSPYLFYPIFCPHGASKSGIMTYSPATISSAERIELPVESGVSKLLDLDRCYSKSCVATANGKELVLYNFHLSAYTTDGKIATEQLKLILNDMEDEYKKGNYVVGGGDFNKDLLGDSSKYFWKSDKEYTWAQPIPEGTFDDYHVSLTAPLYAEGTQTPKPTCRNADAPYREGHQFVVTLDGFLTSDNVTVVSDAVLNSEFAYSDHNAVTMTFRLD